MPAGLTEQEQQTLEWPIALWQFKAGKPFTLIIHMNQYKSYCLDYVITIYYDRFMDIDAAFAMPASYDVFSTATLVHSMKLDPSETTPVQRITPMSD